MGKQKFLIFVIFVIFAVLPCMSCKQKAGVGSADMVTITKVSESAKQGSVIMSHLKHEDADVKCIVCHHKEYNDDRIKNCSECHTGEDAKKTMHDLCIKCHKEKNEGPTGCTGCHKKK